MNAPQPNLAAQAALAIKHVEGSTPTAFELIRLPDGKPLSPVTVTSPYEFPVEGRGKVIMTSRSQEEWLRPEWRVKIPREGLGGLEGEERWEYCEIILRELGVKVNRDDPALKELMDQLAGHP